MVATAAALALAGCGTGGAGGAGGDTGTTTLRFSYMAGEKTPIGELWTWWLDEVEARSGGSVTFERYWDATLLKATETTEGLRDGRADIAQVLPTVYPGKYPLSSVGELPFESSNPSAVAEALGTLSSDESGVLAEEWHGQGLTPLAWSIGTSSALATNKPIRTAADLDGMRLRATDRGSQVLQSVGANLINIELAEIYGSMERGLVDGVYGIPFSFAGALHFPEVAQHFTDLGIGVSSVNALAMSQEKWRSLTPEQQAIFREVSAEAPAKVAEFDVAGDKTSCEAVKQSGGDVHVLAEAESNTIKERGKAALDAEWREQVAADGADAEAFYGRYRAELDAAEKKHAGFKTGVQRCAESAP
ncbi:TRAP transporter substrate-binding protein DctP [Pseudonocardia parietis]|uniref:TRAP-type C4-dicarboxylate transport system substrate-binding protein n=1 Tax=Pseudonocardia parietis TaxID=570936 RepID=A0ABS4VQX5_9PSEU|nr:TRAP transporter substrate-binding protein DctP [Pseudonocardia parietis]MBP2366176.1 TRAP-type C4-dicarboxylate transport system substrate-binding protein [Pseudonocardia parietis]